MDIGTVTLEDPMRCHTDKDEEITRRGATDPNLAFARESHPNAVLDSCRDVDRQRFFASRPTLAAARLAGIVDDPSGTLTAGAGLLHCEETLLHAQASSAMAPRASYQLGAGLGT